MNDRENKIWGIYIWTPQHGMDMIHPDDLKKMGDNPQLYAIFEKIGIEPPYIVLKYDGRVYRVKPELFKPIVKNPIFDFGDEVITKSGKIGTIRTIGWHFKREEPIYYITYQGKPKPTCYFAEDLSLVK